MSKLLTIVVPVYNVEFYIEECLLSILDSIKPVHRELIEVIIVDDKSPDNSMAIVSQLIQGYQEIVKVITHETNQGLSGARNTGLDAAIGSFVTFIDSDDWYKEHAVEALVGMANSLGSNDIMVFGFEAIKGGELKWKFIPDENQQTTSEHALYLLANDKLKPSAWNRIYPTRLAQQVRFKQGVFYEDMEFGPRIFSKISNVFFDARPLINYRQDGSSITRQLTKSKHVEDLSKGLFSIKYSLEDPLLISNFFLNRWGYLLRRWQLDEVLVAKSFSEILVFMDQTNLEHYSQKNLELFLTSLDKWKNISESKLIKDLHVRIVQKIEEDKSKSEPFLSIVIPLFNASKFIPKAIQHFSEQENQCFEVIYIDDCSTDDSASLILSYAKKYDFIKYFKLDKNAGAGVARNFGIKQARGRYIMFHDADDWFNSDGVKIIRTHLEENDYPDLAVFSYSVIDETGKLLWFNKKILGIESEKTDGSSIFEKICTSIINPAPWNKVFKKTVWTKNNITFPEVIHHQDLTAIPFACLKAERATILKTRLYNYVKNSSGVTQTVSDKHVYSPFRAMEALTNHIKKDANENFDEWRDHMISMAYTNFNHNFNLRKELFSNQQIVDFIRHFNLYNIENKIDAIYLITNSSANNLSNLIISEKIKRELEIEILCYTPSNYFEKLIGHISNLNSKISPEHKAIRTKRAPNNKYPKTIAKTTKKESTKNSNNKNSKAWYAMAFKRTHKIYLKYVRPIIRNQTQNSKN